MIQVYIWVLLGMLTVGITASIIIFTIFYKRLQIALEEDIKILKEKINNARGE